MQKYEKAVARHTHLGGIMSLSPAEVGYITANIATLDRILNNFFS